MQGMEAAGSCRLGMNPVEHLGAGHGISPELLIPCGCRVWLQLCNVTLAPCGVLGRCGALGMPRLAGCLPPVPWGKPSSPGSPWLHQQQEPLCQWKRSVAPNPCSAEQLGVA